MKPQYLCVCLKIYLKFECKGSLILKISLVHLTIFTGTFLEIIIVYDS